MPTTPVTGKNYPAQGALIGKTLVLQSNRDEMSPGRVERAVWGRLSVYPSMSR